MRTFLSVFPHATLWAEGSVLIGLAIPERAQGFRDVNVVKFEDLTNLYTAGPNELASYVGDGPLLTDDRPLAECFKRDLSEIVVP